MSYHAGKPARQTGRIHCTRLTGDFPTSLEYNECRDTANTKTSGDPRMLFGIELCQTQTGFQTCRRFGKCGRHGTARAAPGSPEIHNDRAVIASDQGIETCRVKLHGLTGKQRFLAPSASGALGKSLHRYAINGKTVRTNNMHSINHVSAPERESGRHGGRPGNIQD